MANTNLQDIPAWKRNLPLLVLSSILNILGMLMLLALLDSSGTSSERLLISLFATGALGLGISWSRLSLYNRLDPLSWFLLFVGGLGFMAGMGYSLYLYSLLHPS